jgi:hypothetical protein
MATLLYVGESLVYRTVGMMDVALGEVDKSGADAIKETRKAIEEYAVECSIIKVWGSEMIDYIVDETLQIYAATASWRNIRRSAPIATRASTASSKARTKSTG